MTDLEPAQIASPAAWLMWQATFADPLMSTRRRLQVDAEAATFLESDPTWHWAISEMFVGAVNYLGAGDPWLSLRLADGVVSVDGVVVTDGAWLTSDFFAGDDDDHSVLGVDIEMAPLPEPDSGSLALIAAAMTTISAADERSATSSQLAAIFASEISHQRASGAAAFIADRIAEMGAVAVLAEADTALRLFWARARAFEMDPAFRETIFEEAWTAWNRATHDIEVDND